MIKAHYFKLCKNTLILLQIILTKELKIILKKSFNLFFAVDTFWYRQEFAKSRGMIHWHGLCWRKDSEPHNLMFQSTQSGLSNDEIAVKLSDWACENFKMTASHPAGLDENGKSKKRILAPS